MKKSLNLLAIALLGMSVTLTSCKKKSKSVWDDGNTVTSAQSRTLWGNDEGEDSFSGPANEDFVALKDEDLKTHLVDNVVAQPAFSPGEYGSGLPGHEMFRRPTDKLAALFTSIYFGTDEYTVKNPQTLANIERIADYLKEHPGTFVYIEGYCDERGPEAYNLSLGARRANYVRSTLVQKGVAPEQLHTISFGKEKPADFHHSIEAWAKNRRAEFKIYQR